MRKLKIIIPTKGRVNNQLTAKNLPPILHQQLVFVCPSTEVEALRKQFPEASVVAQGNDNFNISEKRKWIVEWAEQCGYEKIVMLDDDLRFAVRRKDDPTKFESAVNEEIFLAFVELEGILSPEYPHAGFSARGMSIGTGAQKGGWQEGKRMMYVLGYYLPIVSVYAEFGRTLTHEDMDVCLQLLTFGFPNLVNLSFVVDQKFGNPGGCTDERDLEVSDNDVLLLQSFFPEFVRVEKKSYAGSPDRLEVVCYWLKALQSGKEVRALIDAKEKQ